MHARPIDNLDDNGTPSREDIVALAYSMAIGTERFYELMEALAACTDPIFRPESDDVHTEETVALTLSALEPHFENALSLMHASAKRQKKPKHSVQAMENDTLPHVLVTPRGHIVYANAAANTQFGARQAQAIDHALFEPETLISFKKALATLESFENSQMVATFEICRADCNEITRVGLRRIHGENQETLGQISTLTTSWRADLAAEFKAAMNITPVEIEIVRAVVTGMSLNDLANKRGRAVGTVRLQSKKLLQKLHLRSQTELVCLYVSFCELHVGTAADNAHAVAMGGPVQLLTFSDGRNLEYECAGPAGGRPVLFFPALLGGTALTQQMRQSLFKKNINLIMVWRPGFAQSGFDGPANFDAFARHTGDLKALLAMLGVTSCPVIGHITSVMFAYAMASYAPECVDKIVCVNGTVPSRSGAHVASLDKGERLRFMLLRRAPKIGRMILHSMLAKVDAGFDEEFLSTFLNNPIDQITIHDPAIRDTFRDAFTKTIAQGYDSFVHELTLGALDWEPLISGVTCPIDLLVGEGNPIYTPKLVTTYAQERQGMSVITVPQTAHLALYQDFERILDATITAPKA
ncbi:MAG: pimeloyl-ACP methyl ester carboxylesterase/DNA-binding CsgD family transcriptional regulator [Gammaproteobacteria bacterium]|jgi:pimeloyl-ACP methyl ester carboxylesterase/DNA-binding CsgD family transcriptional regulator